jgi:hypothetical protein
MTISGNRILLAAIFIPALLFAGACDNSFDPTGPDNGTFSVQGTLDLLEETSYIRVRDMNEPFTLEATEELDATVTLQNLDAGTSTQLGSSVREYEGTYLHTFFVEDGVFPDTRYQLRVENSEGVLIEMNTVTPTLPQPQITRDNDACTTPVNLVFEPMNGGTFTLRYGTKLDTEEEDGIWDPRIIELGPANYTDRISLTFIPERRAQGATFSSAPCSSLLRYGHLYIAIAHYSPGFYEELNSDENTVLESTRQFGGFYADTLAIPVDVTQ